jgi:hypothetical protein
MPAGLDSPEVVFGLVLLRTGLLCWAGAIVLIFRVEGHLFLATRANDDSVTLSLRIAGESLASGSRGLMLRSAWWGPVAAMVLHQQFSVGHEQIRVRVIVVERNSIVVKMNAAKGWYANVVCPTQDGKVSSVGLDVGWALVTVRVKISPSEKLIKRCQEVLKAVPHPRGSGSIHRRRRISLCSTTSTTHSFR